MSNFGCRDPSPLCDRSLEDRAGAIAPGKILVNALTKSVAGSL
jgi:hypothetical protein